jgi:hypothetical protein
MAVLLFTDDAPSSKSMDRLPVNFHSNKDDQTELIKLLFPYF